MLDGTKRVRGNDKRLQRRREKEEDMQEMNDERKAGSVHHDSLLFCPSNPMITLHMARGNNRDDFLR
jgi:hypothetical protein